VRAVLAKKRLRISHVAAILVCAPRSSQLRDVARSANRALHLVNSRLTGNPEIICGCPALTSSYCPATIEPSQSPFNSRIGPFNVYFLLNSLLTR
jgi:hypothetical protein